jgi:hypothetical protein
MITTQSGLDTESLARLIAGEVLAIRVPSFVDPEICASLAAWLIDHANAQPYTHEIRRDGAIEHKYFGVDRVGSPFNRVIDTAPDSAERAAYYSEALATIRRFREATSPRLSPIDKLRLELDEIWPGGATLARFEGKAMFVGIGRIMRPATSASSETNPHVDVLPRVCCELGAQLAANVYLAVPPDGGDLEIWDGVRGSQSNPVTPFGRPANPPDVSVQPQVGELVIFNSWQPHAVSRFATGVRVAVQAFIGAPKQPGPLVLWD